MKEGELCSVVGSCWLKRTLIQWWAPQGQTFHTVPRVPGEGGQSWKVVRQGLECLLGTLHGIGMDSLQALSCSDPNALCRPWPWSWARRGFYLALP